MRCSALLPLVFLSLPLTTLVGCSDDAPQPKGSASKFTVANGDKFVESATPEKIVLRKYAEDMTFPFDEKSLLNKAILIHPVVQRAEDGVYARATDVQFEDNRYVITSTPLTLEEMTTITEDEIVRIYIDLGKSSGKQGDGPTLVPESFPGLDTNTIHPMGLGLAGVGFGGFDVGGFDFKSPVFLMPGISFKHTVKTKSLTTQAYASYTSEEGLDVGVKGEVEWESNLVVNGKVGGEFFHSQSLQSPSLVTFLPIGPVPVPVSLSAEAFVSCATSAANFIDASVDISFSAKVAASVRVSPSKDKPASEWVSAGSFPNEASGTGGIDITPGASLGTETVTCALPRVQISAKIAGVAGPYLAITPAATLSTGGSTVSATISAGVAASVLGVGTGAEIPVYKWTPSN